MYIKAQTVIPAGTKITRVAASEGKGKSVWTLLRAEERKLEKEAEMRRLANRVTAAIKAGYTVEEAIELCKE